MAKSAKKSKSGKSDRRPCCSWSSRSQRSCDTSCDNDARIDGDIDRVTEVA